MRPGTQNKKIEANMLDNLMQTMWEEGKLFLDVISDLHPGAIFVILVIIVFFLLQRVKIFYRFFSTTRILI